MIDTANRLFATGDILISSLSASARRHSKKPLPADVLKMLANPEVTSNYKSIYSEEDDSDEEEYDAELNNIEEENNSLK